MHRHFPVLLGLLVLTNVAAAQQKKLGYPLDKELKDAIYYLDQVEGITQQIETKSANMKVGDPSVPIQDVNNLLSNLERCHQYMTNVSGRFKKLPADHPDVIVERKRFDDYLQRLIAQQDKLKAIRDGLNKVVNQGETAEWKTDFDRLREINQMFGDPQILQSQPERAIEVIKQIGPVKDERARIQQKYAALLQQQTPQSKDMNGVLRYFDERFGKFDAAVQEYAAAAPAAIAGDIDEALAMGKDAVANKKYLFFGDGGGVAQRLSWAETKTSVLIAIAPDSPQAREAQQKLTEARAAVKQMKSALNDDIIANNRPPEDRYRGGDRDQLLEMINAKWAKEGNGGEVLKTGINGNEWQRGTRWEWSSGYKAWEKVDKSRLQGYVIVKSGETEAVAHYINLSKDHMANDSVKAYFLNDPKEEPDLSYRMLLKNVK